MVNVNGFADPSPPTADATSSLNVPRFECWRILTSFMSDWILMPGPTAQMKPSSVEVVEREPLSHFRQLSPALVRQFRIRPEERRGPTFEVCSHLAVTDAAAVEHRDRDVFIEIWLRMSPSPSAH